MAGRKPEPFEEEPPHNVYAVTNFKVGRNFKCDDPTLTAKEVNQANAGRIFNALVIGHVKPGQTVLGGEWDYRIIKNGPRRGEIIEATARL
jgi:hypothetical protein